MELRQGLNLGDGPRRVFPIRRIYAHAFITTLLTANVDFAVVNGRGRVDVITPYDLKADLFPNNRWVEDGEPVKPLPYPLGDEPPTPEGYVVIPSR